MHQRNEKNIYMEEIFGYFKNAIYLLMWKLQKKVLPNGEHLQENDKL